MVSSRLRPGVSCPNIPSFPSRDCAKQSPSVAIPVNSRFLADLFCLNIKTTHNEDGVHSASELYKMLLEIRAWLYEPDPDHSAKWYKRRKAEEHSKILTESTSAAFDRLNSASWGESLKSMFGFAAKKPTQQPTLLRELGGLLANDALKSKNPDEAAHLMWMLAATGVGSPVTAIAEVLQFFLSSSGSAHWADLVKLAGRPDSPTTDAQLERYFLEAQRLTSAQLVKHRANDTDTLLDIGAAGRNKSAPFPSPNEFRLDEASRPLDKYIVHGFGPRGQLGRDMLLAYGTGLLKVAARTKGLRTAPKGMGELKQVNVGGRRHYLTADWAYVVDEPTGWKLAFDELPSM